MRFSYCGSTGFKFFIAFLAFSYGIQLLMYYFVSDNPVIWNYSQPSFKFYFSLVYFISFFVLFTYNQFRINTLVSSSKLVFIVSKFLSKIINIFWFKIRYIHVFVFFIASVFWFVSGLSNYRYDGKAISDKLTLELLVGMLWKVFFFADFWFHISYYVLFKRRLKYKWKYLINISFLLTLTGTTSALYFLVHLLYVITPRSFEKVLNTSCRRLVLRRKTYSLKHVILFMSLLFVPLLGYHYGEVIKTNKNLSFAERYLDSRSQQIIKQFFVQRFSTTLYAHTHLLEDVDYNVNEYIDHIKIPVDNLSYRLDAITGRIFGLNKPKYASINQLNYDVLSSSGKIKTAGASPGLLPGFMYLMNPWVSFIIAAWFLAKMAIIINNTIPNSTFFYSVLSMLLLIDLVKAPVLALNPLDPVFFNLVFALGLVGVLKNAKS